MASTEMLPPSQDYAESGPDFKLTVKGSTAKSAMNRSKMSSASGSNRTKEEKLFPMNTRDLK